MPCESQVGVEVYLREASTQEFPFKWPLFLLSLRLTTKETNSREKRRNSGGAHADEATKSRREKFRGTFSKGHKNVLLRHCVWYMRVWAPIPRCLRHQTKKGSQHA